MNKNAFDALDDDVKQIVLDAASKAEARGWELSKNETAAKTTELNDNGMTVTEPSDTLLNGLKSIGSDMQKAWQDEASDDAKTIVDAYTK